MLVREERKKASSKIVTRRERARDSLVELAAHSVDRSCDGLLILYLACLFIADQAGKRN